MSREAYYIRFDEERERYVLSVVSWLGSAAAVDSWPARHVARDFTLKDAVRAAGRLLDSFFRDLGQLSELIVVRRDGTFGERRTYPRSSDPKRSRG